MKKNNILLFYFFLTFLLFVLGCDNQQPATRNYTVGVVNLNIHLKTAETIGIDIPDDILQAADTIIR